MTPILPLFAGHIMKNSVTEQGIFLPPAVMSQRLPCLVQIASIDPEYSKKHDVKVKDLCLFQRGMLPFQKSPDGSGVLLMQVSALIAVIERRGEPYIRPLNGQALVEVNYDNSRIIESISPDFVYKPADTNRAEFINECRIAYLPEDAKKIPELKEGIKAWAHHFIVEENNRFDIGGKTYSRINATSIFFVEKDGEIIPVGDNVLCKKSGKEMLEEKLQSGIVLMHDERQVTKTRNRVQVVMAAKDRGFNDYIGKDVYITKGCDYPIRLNGQEYFRVYERFIEGVVNPVQMGLEGYTKRKLEDTIYTHKKDTIFDA